MDGFLVVTPYYNKPPVRGIVAHFRAIAEATDRPIVVYNIPQRVVVNLEPETLAELAEIPNVPAVKQATDPGQARRILEETDLALYAGNDDLLLPFLELGGIGRDPRLHAPRGPARARARDALQGRRRRGRAGDRRRSFGR